MSVVCWFRADRARPSGQSACPLPDPLPLTPCPGVIGLRPLYILNYFLMTRVSAGLGSPEDAAQAGLPGRPEARPGGLVVGHRQEEAAVWADGRRGAGSCGPAPQGRCPSGGPRVPFGASGGRLVEKHRLPGPVGVGAPQRLRARARQDRQDSRWGWVTSLLPAAGPWRPAPGAPRRASLLLVVRQVRGPSAGRRHVLHQAGAAAGEGQRGVPRLVCGTRSGAWLSAAGVVL